MDGTRATKIRTRRPTKPRTSAPVKAAAARSPDQPRARMRDANGESVAAAMPPTRSDATVVESRRLSARRAIPSPTVTSTRQPTAARWLSQLGTSAAARFPVVIPVSASSARPSPAAILPGAVDTMRSPIPLPNARTMTDVDAALEAHLDTTRADRLDSYKDFLRIPSISALPANLDDCRRAAGWLVEALTAAGLEHAEAAETGGPPDRLRRLAPRTGAPDGPRLRPLRRPAGRPARPVDLAAVRAGHRRRPDAGARRGRRQGPDPRPRDGRPGRPRDPWRAAGQRQVRLRGRGGIDLAAPRAVARREPRRRSPPTSRSSATPASSRATSRPSPSPCAGSCTPRST